MGSSAPDFVSITEVDDGSFFVADLFAKKFGGAPPQEPHHLVAVYRSAPHAVGVLCYAHFMEFGDIILVGGVCTNGELIRGMPEPHREALAASGSLYGHVLQYGFQRFAGRCEAYFGYCGDARAEEVNLQSGFERTQHPNLLVNFHRKHHPVMQRALIAKAAAIGPF